MLYIRIYNGKHIIIPHKYFGSFSKPSRVFVDKALYQKIIFTAEIKN